MADVPKLELRLLGELEIRRDGARIALPSSRKTRALLAYLAASPRARRREHLCALLWDVPDDPKGALRWSLSKIRALVDAPERPRLRADRDHVRLDLDGAAVDLLEVKALAAVEWAAPTPLLEDVAQSCCGPFCDGLDLPRCHEFQSWCVAEREDVRQLQVALLRRLTERLRDSPARRLAHLRRLVEIDPLDEEVRLMLVETLDEAGRRDEAEQQAEIGVAVLREAAIPVPPSLAGFVPRRGAISPPAAPAAAPAAVSQHVHFCTAPDGTRIAYACVGEGTPLVKTANWLNHLEYEWESPIWRHWLRALSRGRMLLRYDERGNGLSDREPRNLCFDALVQDLESVVDAAGLEQFDLLGVSQGCAVSVAYAVRHPDRVRRLVLYGGYATGWHMRGDPLEIERREAMITLIRSGWGQDNPAFRQMYTTLYFPEATAEEADWFNELQRVSASPAAAQRLLRVLGDIDVRHLLPLVKAPTLVLHSRNDAVIPFEAGRAIAARIPGAEFVALESSNHLLLEHQPAWPKLLHQLEAFLSEAEPRPAPLR